MTHPQRRLLFRLLADLTITSREDRLRAASHVTSRPVESTSDLTAAEFRDVVDHLQAVLSWPEADRRAEVDILTRPVGDLRAVAS